jgi:hypothetical protein
MSTVEPSSGVSRMSIPIAYPPAVCRSLRLRREKVRFRPRSRRSGAQRMAPSWRSERAELSIPNCTQRRLVEAHQGTAGYVCCLKPGSAMTETVGYKT